MSWLIYGVNGYTGELIAREAARRGMKPIVAGRRADAVRAIAEPLGLEARSFGLDDAAALDAGLEGVTVVMHCAGPFSRTAKPMASACIRRRVHYLDVTGEIEVFETLAAQDAAASAAGVMLMPGVGFDVVPSDCLAAHLKRRLPTATHLTLAFLSTGGLSRGTATTMVENLHRGGMVRREGKLTRVPAAWRTRTFDFGRGPKKAVTIPWGDVSTAWRTTGIGNVEVYLASPLGARMGLRAARLLRPLLPLVQGRLVARVQAGRAGPSDAERAAGRTIQVGEAWDASGTRVTSRQFGPDGYTTTYLAALACVQRVLDGNAPAGYQTPAKAYGPDLILEIEGVRREDL